MFKKFLLFVLFLVPAMLMAQERIAYINYTEMIQSMPEFSEANAQLQNEAAALEKDIMALQEELQKKQKTLIDEGDTLPEAVRIRRVQELNDLEQRIQTFYQQSQQQLELLQQNLYIPIQEKLSQAVKSVGDANNYTYILDSSTIIYINPNAINATTLVKKELGIQ